MASRGKPSSCQTPSASFCMVGDPSGLAARLLAALTTRRCLLSLVAAAARAAALAALARAAALASPAGGAGRVGDRGRAGLAHALLAQPFVLLVVLDA